MESETRVETEAWVVYCSTSSMIGPDHTLLHLILSARFPYPPLYKAGTRSDIIEGKWQTCHGELRVFTAPPFLPKPCPDVQAYFSEAMRVNFPLWVGGIKSNNIHLSG